ncbi:MAG: hypothetical protein ACRDQZ_25915 [Mycobacteriales bacterium]
MTISELITGVLVDLGVSPFDACPAINCDTGPPIAISCLVLAVNNALNGCNQPTPTATPTAAAPKLSLGLEVVGFPDEQQTVVVAVLAHFGGEVVSYEFGCTAECYPQFKQAITFQVTGPNGDVILDNCGAPALCAEGAVAFAAGESLQQALWSYPGLVDT